VRKILDTTGLPNNIGIPINKVHFYTNSISGINEFNVSDVDSQIPEDNLFLLGGNPLATYRATTGDFTVDELDRLSDYARKNSVIILSILTANWVTVGPGYNDLNLCAKGKGHLHFKEKAQEISHTTIVVAPLGKILADEKTHNINQIMKSCDMEEYESTPVENSMRKMPDGNKMVKKAILLTTFRNHRSSPLMEHSAELYQAHKNSPPDKIPTYDLADVHPVPEYEPSGSTPEQEEIEMPHKYIREERRKLLRAAS